MFSHFSSQGMFQQKVSKFSKDLFLNLNLCFSNFEAIHAAPPFSFVRTIHKQSKNIPQNINMFSFNRQSLSFDS